MKEQFKLFDSEYRFMTLIWKHEPINSTELVKLCHEELGWTKSTTYTVLRKLKNKNILKNENALVESIVSHEQVRKYETEQLIDKNFNNSLPKFLTTFLGDKKISKEEAEELKRIIDESRDDRDD